MGIIWLKRNEIHLYKMHIHVQKPQKDNYGRFRKLVVSVFYSGLLPWLCGHQCSIKFCWKSIGASFDTATPTSTPRKKSPNASTGATQQMSAARWVELLLRLGFNSWDAMWHQWHQADASHEAWLAESDLEPSFSVLNKGEAEPVQKCHEMSRIWNLEKSRNIWNDSLVTWHGHCECCSVASPLLSSARELSGLCACFHLWNWPSKT